MQLDMYYCLEFLRQKGVCVVPGSGFGKLPDRWHFRYAHSNSTSFVNMKPPFGSGIKLEPSAKAMPGINMAFVERLAAFGSYYLLLY